MNEPEDQGAATYELPEIHFTPDGQHAAEPSGDTAPPAVTPPAQAPPQEFHVEAPTPAEPPAEELPAEEPLIERHDPFLHVNDENDDVRRFDSELHLIERRASDDVLGFLAAQQADAAGVHERERPAEPLDFGADAVARDTRLVVHDGDATARDAVEERGFADVRPTNNSNESRHTV